MNTGNMPEDELDDLFRKSASEIQPEFDPTAWQAMEKKLDAHHIQVLFWKRIGGLTALLLLLGTIYWMSQKSGEKEENNIATTSQSQTLPDRELVPDTNKKANLPKLASGGDQKGLSAVAPAESPQSNPEQEKSLSRQKEKIAALRESRNGQTVSFGSKILDSNINNQTAPEQNNLPEAVVVIKTEREDDNKQIQTKLPASDVASVNPVDSVSAKVKIQKPGDSTIAMNQVSKLDNTNAARRIKPAFINRVSISLLVAPDLSTVGFTNPGGISTNAGVLLSYQLTNKWSLSTGLIRARKIYNAKPEDYKSGYWSGGYKPENISAVCGVLDIPVNIGLRIMQKEKSAIIINTGLSSYIMRQEKYNYDYGHYGKKTYEFSNQNRHLFSTYNLSGSYTRQLSRSVAVGAEPFVKVPLAGVGAGKVKLASAGVFFSLSYRYAR